MAITASSRPKHNFKEDCSLSPYVAFVVSIDNAVMIYLTETFRCSKLYFFTQKLVRKIVFKLNYKAREQDF